MTDVKTRTAAVVYNPVKVDLESLRAAVDAEAGAAGWAESRWYETSEEDPGQGMTRQAIADGADLIIAAGGDGTVRAVAEAVRGSGTSVALLPSGTGNLLARNLKLTLDDVPDSVRTAFTGVDRAIDLGVVEIEREDRSRSEHVFVVMAGMGIDAKMIENTDEDLKAKAGWAAYLKAIVASLRDPDELHLRFRLDDGKPKRATVHTVILGNCGSLPGNILLLPDAVLDDGLLDLMMMRPGGALGWIRVWLKVAWVNGILRRTKAGRAVAGEHSQRRRSALRDRHALRRPPVSAGRDRTRRRRIRPGDGVQRVDRTRRPQRPRSGRGGIRCLRTRRTRTRSPRSWTEEVREGARATADRTRDMQQWVTAVGRPGARDLRGTRRGGQGRRDQADRQYLNPRRRVSSPCRAHQAREGTVVLPALHRTAAHQGRDRADGPLLVQPRRRREGHGLLHEEEYRPLPRPGPDRRADARRRRHHPGQVLVLGVGRPSRRSDSARGSTIRCAAGSCRDTDLLVDHASGRTTPGRRTPCSRPPTATTLRGGRSRATTRRPPGSTRSATCSPRCRTTRSTRSRSTSLRVRPQPASARPPIEQQKFVPDHAAAL